MLGSTIITPLAKDLYRGILRILVILHHDFPEFLAENHFRLCNIIPAQCTQLRNLVLSAYPASIPMLPDPFTVGLKVDRLEGIREKPKLAEESTKPLLRRNLKGAVDWALQNNDMQSDGIDKIVDATYFSGSRYPLETSVDVSLLHSIVLYIGSHAVSGTAQKGGPVFADNSPHSNFMSTMSKALQPEARYYFLSAIADQLRYPNSHTHFFSHTLLHLFIDDLADQQQASQQIVRVLLERLIVHRPHPWGLIITLMELIKNPTYAFWELSFIKAAPQVRCRVFLSWQEEADRCSLKTCSRYSSSIYRAHEF